MSMAHNACTDLLLEFTRFVSFVFCFGDNGSPNDVGNDDVARVHFVIKDLERYIEGPRL